MDELQHPFESSIAADHESEPVRQSQLLDSSLYSDKTIPEFDEQDYQSHRNIYVGVHMPKRTSKHKHRSKKRHSRGNGHGHHSDRRYDHNDVPDYPGNEPGNHEDKEHKVYDEPPHEPELAATPEYTRHRKVVETHSDAPQFASSRRSSLGGIPKYSKSHSIDMGVVGAHRHNELNIPEVIREPVTPSDPCDRVKFILGSEDTESANHDPTVHTIFTELEELKYDENDHQKMEWKETARWVKFEEDVEEGGNKWSKPHVATLSLHSLFELRSCLMKGTVLLDMKADNLAQISDYVLDNLICTGQLEEENRDKVRSALLQRHKHLNSRKDHSENRILESIRSLGDIGRLNSMSKAIEAGEQPQTNSHRGLFGNHNKSVSSLPGLAGSRAASRRNSIQQGVGMFDGNGSGQGSALRLEDEPTNGSDQDLHMSKAVHNFMKKIPPGSEASNVLVGEVDFLTHSIIAFVRLSEGSVLGDITEVPIPTRFLFILLGPNGNQERYHEIGRSIATLMSDEVFHEVAYRARKRADLLAGIDEFLDKVTVLPPGEWDPQIRLEPPSQIPSQEDRKQSIAPAKMQKKDKKDDDKRINPIKWTKIPFGGYIDDVLRCYSLYRSDLRDAVSLQLISSIILIYFANITIAFTFGAFLSDITHGALGATEMVLAVGLGNFVFSIFAGQPLIILGATGPTVIFEQILFSFCESQNIPFLEFRFWIGLWTAIFIIVLVGLNSSVVMRLFTRFTEEIFSALISFVFMYEALVSLWNIHLKYPYNGWVLLGTIQRDCFCYSFPTAEDLVTANLTNATKVGSYWSDAHVEVSCESDVLRKFVGNDCPGNLFEHHDVFLMSVILFFGTFLVCFYLKKFRDSRIFRTIVRRIISEFAVFISVVVWVIVDVLAGVNTPKLEVPNVFTEAVFTSPNRTDLFINPLGNGLPHWTIAAAIIPAILATILLFVDQHITALIVNRKDNKLKKGTGYHVDMLIVGCLIFVHSVLGLPWVVGATILSISHVQSLFLYRPARAPGESHKFLGVREQRGTLFVMSILVGMSVMVYSVLKLLPLPVLYGLLFYLGAASLYGVQFVQRFKLLFIPNKYKPDYAYLRRIPNFKIHMFTIIQVVFLAVLCVFQAVAVLRVVFPLMVVTLMFGRWLLGFFFTRRDLAVLDDPLPEKLYCRRFRGDTKNPKNLKCDDISLEDGKMESEDTVDGPENYKDEAVTEQPSGNNLNISARNATFDERRNSNTEFNITQEVDKCDIWRTMVKDLEAPYSSPKRAARYGNPGPAITVTDGETALGYVEVEDESSTANMLPQRQESSDFGKPKSRACRKLFLSTEI